jgi:hypothetical protein
MCLTIPKKVLAKKENGFYIVEKNMVYLPLRHNLRAKFFFMMA